VENDQIHHEKLEQNVDHKEYPTKCRVIFTIHILDQPYGQIQRHGQLYLLQPQISIKMLAIALPNTVSKPRTMMIIGGHTLLTQSTMPGPQWHINQALCAISQADLNFPSFLAPLNGCEIFFMNLLLIWLLVLQLVVIGVVIHVGVAYRLRSIRIPKTHPNLPHLRLNKVLTSALTHLSGVLN